MEIKFVPKACSESKTESGEVVKATLSGSITVEALSYPERMRMKAKFANLQTAPADAKDLSLQQKLAAERMEAIAIMADDLLPKIRAVDLTDIASGRKAESAETLYDDPAFDEAVGELVVAFVMGLRPN